ncbi:hypothetical protein CAPTEDRAFT_217667 [Capitella teleta]|uniref:G-protein coupled receptors family 1 profile domain-containing protein n=1 Tax=Capitella teleta TaxID=283909 RepID=X2AMI6_CAPTE|nr:hypothetical protein CAPTEDRAFT_217667 [Capitella teleta]|eukprot:ELU00284.1 hypothetical protein CAPTEDRAFT_217667 [Capitella teleta]
MVTTDDAFSTEIPLTDDNATFDCGFDGPEEAAAFTVQLAGILTLAALCIFGNSVVIYVMIKGKTLNSPLNNLAISDLLQGIIYAIYNISHVNIEIIRLTLGHWSVCCPLLLMVLVTLASSAFNLVGITVVRFMSVRWPLQHRHILNQRRVTIGIALAWSLAFVFGITFYVRPEPENYCGVCRSELHWQFYQLFGMLIIPATIPFVVMVCLYCSMAKIYRSHMKSMAAHRTTTKNSMSTNNAMDKSEKNERTLSRVSAFLVVYFLFSYMPFIVFTLVHKLCDCNVNGFWRSTVRIILFSNTTVNFFAYIIAHQDFRHAVTRIFCRQKFRAQQLNLNNTETSESIHPKMNISSERELMKNSISTITLTALDLSNDTTCTTLA